MERGALEACFCHQRRQTGDKCNRLHPEDPLGVKNHRDGGEEGEEEGEEEEEEEEEAAAAAWLVPS